jgi:hypothetical protein
MEMFMTSVLIAVDAENVSHKLLPGIDSLGMEYGEVIGRKVFGDFDMIRMRPWIEASRNNLYTMVNSPHVKSKNIADMTMIIEIMEAVFDWRPDVVVIGTGDGDFIPLANKLRSKGIIVIGAGAQESSTQFKQACDSFRIPELFDISMNKSASDGIILPKSVSKMLSRIASQILKQYHRHEWVPISRVGDELNRQHINLDLRKLGVVTLSEAIFLHTGFEVQKDGKQVSFRKKPLSNERLRRFKGAGADELIVNC